MPSSSRRRGSNGGRSRGSSQHQHGALQKPEPTCCQNCCQECIPCQPWFAVEEPSSRKKLDVAASFGPSTGMAFVSKLLTCGYIVATQVMAWMASPYLYFYYAYYTSWALLFATIYALLSIGNTMCEVPQPLDGRVGGRAKFTWIMFNLAIFAQGLATLVYWSMVHDYSEMPIYLDVATHGIVFVVVAIDGFVISRIPLRWMHLWLSWTVLGIYLIWSYVHEALQIGNPNENDNDPATNDDAIYASLSWKDEDVPQTTVLALALWLVVSPVLFCLLRAVSVWNGNCCGNSDRRRYLTDDVEHGYRRVK
ncbi:hypothetical protein ACA910_010226 [Epithemia clementina (nom. ined.)]